MIVSNTLFKPGVLVLNSDYYPFSGVRDTQIVVLLEVKRALNGEFLTFTGFINTGLLCQTACWNKEHYLPKIIF